MVSFCALKEYEEKSLSVKRFAKQLKAQNMKDARCCKTYQPSGTPALHCPETGQPLEAISHFRFGCVIT